MTPLNLNTRYLRYLLAVVDEGSFSRAAERLSVSQPAISRRIRMLERELDFPLLERLPRKVALTPQGLAMLPAFRDLVRAASDAGDLIQKISLERARVPRIGAAVYAVQVERSALLADYEAAFPDARFEIETGHTRALLHGLGKGTFDIIVVASPIPDERFKYIALRWFPVELVVSQDSPLAACKTVPVSALAGLSIATWERVQQPQIFKQMVAPLQGAGTRVVFPEDQGKLGILAYAADHGIATTRSFDEYDDDDLRRVGMIALPLENVQPVAALMLLRLSQSSHPNADRLWNFARRWADQRSVPQRRDEIRFTA